MPRLSTGEAAQRCAWGLEAEAEKYMAARLKIMNTLATRLSRQGTMSDISAFMMALWGVSYDDRVQSSPQDTLLTVLDEFNTSNAGKIFATNKPDGSHGSTTRLYSVGHKNAHQPRSKSGPLVIHHGERTIYSMARFWVGVYEHGVTGEVVVPTYSVASSLFDTTATLPQPAREEFTAFEAIRSLDEDAPHVVRVKPVLWNQEIISDVIRMSDFTVAANGLTAAQRSFKETPGYN